MLWEFENAVLLTLLTTLMALVSCVWQRNRILLSSVHSNPDLFKLSAGAAFVNIRQGVEISVAKIQADADRAADRLPEEGEGAAQPDRFTYNNDANNKITAAQGAVGGDGEISTNTLISSSSSSHYDEENLPPNNHNSEEIYEHEDDSVTPTLRLSPMASLSASSAHSTSSAAIRKRK
jgi:hypothetical protein